MAKFIPATGIIIDKGKVHILNPGRVKNIAAGFVDTTGFHPIRSSPDYDPDRLFDDTESGNGNRRKKKKSSTKKTKAKTMRVKAKVKRRK